MIYHFEGLFERGDGKLRCFDFRSDTCTMPTEEMFTAVANAKLGNDGYGDDPTVNELERKAASLLGKDAGLLLPSGTMGNLVALMTHCNRGDEVIVEANAHIFIEEMGGIGSVAQLIPRSIEGTLGVIQPEQVEKFIRPKSKSTPGTGLVCIENTHNRAGGVVFPTDIILGIAETAHACNIPLHVDGARIFNAAVALGVDVRELTGPADSVMFCLSKGLACPIGSVLVGSQEFIEKARRVRHMLGGRMRQAGVIAANGIVALSSMIDRLVVDHVNAKRLAQGLSRLSCVQIDLDTVQTNIIRFKISDEKIDGTTLTQKLKNCGILIDYRGTDYEGIENFRMVTHKDIDTEAVDNALACIKEIINNL